jgi:hypothetical protein
MFADLLVSLIEAVISFFVNAIIGTVFGPLLPEEEE